MSESHRPSAWNRRDVLRLGAAASAAFGTEGLDGSAAAGAPSPEPGLRTALCDLLGIQHPILQAPMSGVVTPALVAAVGRAGGLGILPGVGVPPEELRRQIREVRGLTDRPFGVNLLLHPGIRQPADVATIPEETVSGVQAVLNRFRERLGLPTTLSRPAPFPATVDAAFEVILEERVPVFSIGLGTPLPAMVARCRERGTKVIAMVATVPDALEVAEGVDAIVAQGGEAGGHRSTWVKREGSDRAVIGTMVLVPQVVSAVRVPVIAAGGLMDGRQLAAALALGAQGVLMGTRFIATAESAAPAFYKEALTEHDSDATVVTDAFTGLYARLLRNAFSEEYAASGAPVFPPVIHFVATFDVTSASAAKGHGDYYPMYAGQGVGMIRDLPAAADVVRSVIREARETIAGLSTRVRTSSS